MKRLVLLLALGALAAHPAPAMAQPPEARPRGVLAPVKVGQYVTLKEVAGRWDISWFPGQAVGLRVTEVSSEHLAVQDVAGLVETRIPVHAIHAVRISKIGKEIDRRK